MSTSPNKNRLRAEEDINEKTGERTPPSSADPPSSSSARPSPTKQSSPSSICDSPLLNGKSFTLLLESGNLSLEDFVKLHWILRRPYTWLDYVACSRHPTNGPVRFGLWKKSLFPRTYSQLHHGAQQKKKKQPTSGYSPISASTTVPTTSDDSSDAPLSILDQYLRAIEGIQFEEVNRLSSGIDGEIYRDVVRTYQTNPLFLENNVAREMLARILIAVSRSCKEVGYCQGMNFVTGAMILARMPEDFVVANGGMHYNEANCREMEVDIYEMLLQLITKEGKFGMMGLWAERIPKLKLRVYQLDRLLRWYHPRLHAHFAKISLSPEVLTAQWFITLFAYNFPVETVLNLWDYIFLSGWEGIFRIAVSLLSLLQEQLLGIEDMEGVAMLMKEWKKVGHLGSNFTLADVWHNAADLIINEEVLLRLQESYAHELLSLVEIFVRETEQYKVPEAKAGTSSSPSPSNNNTSNKSSSSSQGGSDKTEYQIKTSNVDEDPNLLTNNTKKAPVIHKMRLLGGDTPTFWLLRYGNKLSASVARELQNINKELLMLDEQVDRDKQLIQSKILRVCDAHREAQESVDQSSQALVGAEVDYLECAQQYEQAMQQAQQISAEASTVIQSMESTAKVQDKSGPIRSKYFQLRLNNARESHHALQSTLTSTASTDPAAVITSNNSKEQQQQQQRDSGGGSVPDGDDDNGDEDDPENDHEDEGDDISGEGEETVFEFKHKAGLFSNNLDVADAGAGEESSKKKFSNSILSKYARSLSLLNPSSLASGSSSLTTTRRSFYQPSLTSSQLSTTPPPANNLAYRKSDSEKSSSSGDNNSSSSWLGNLSTSISNILPANHIITNSITPFRNGAQLKSLEQSSQKAQQSIIHAHRKLEQSAKAVLRCRQDLDMAKLYEEELTESKKSLCDQLQLLVEDSNRGRSQKLLFVTENFVL